MAEKTKGTFFGVGVGPGDPKLITVRALEVLKSVPVVFAAGSSKNEYSIALNVVQDYLPESSEVRKLDFPMTQSKETLNNAWEENARQVIEVLEQGLDAAFITIGDPLTYSTNCYLVRTIQRLCPDARLETIPGITAYNAAAARLNLPLVESKESLLVVSGVSDPKTIPDMLAASSNVVIMKTYRNFDRILDELSGAPNCKSTYAVSNCCLPDERIHENVNTLRGQKMPYLSMVIVKGENTA